MAKEDQVNLRGMVRTFGDITNLNIVQVFFRLAHQIHHPGAISHKRILDKSITEKQDPT